MKELVYLLYFQKFIVLVVASIAMAKTITQFLKYLGFPQTKQTTWYLAYTIFLIISQILLIVFVMRMPIPGK